MSEDDKPFACPEYGCGMRFTNEDHLNVHMKKHEMSLALNLGGPTSSPAHPFLDQTPTPTKFLRNCEELGLFQELSKNPFEEAFKKASDSEVVPLPGPHSNDLNTPVPPDPKVDSHVGGVRNLSNNTDQDGVFVAEDGVLDLSGRRPSRQSVAPQPSSTTSDDDISIVTSQAADSTVSPSKSSVTSPSLDAMTHSTVSVSSPMTSKATVVPPVSSSAGQQQYTMQVYLQLPTGQTVPVHIPAAINPLPVAVPVITPKVTTSPVVTTTAASNSGSSLALKQRLKQTLQASHHQNQNSPVTPKTEWEPSHTLLPVSSPQSTNSTSVPLSIPSSDESPTDSTDMDISLVKRSKKGVDDDPDERRRKFLERNRAAAARCRQKRKQWITNLEKKAEELQSTNSRLQSEVNQLRGEVAQLKTLLLAHKDCPITLQQKSQGQISLHTFSLVESSTPTSAASFPTDLSISLPTVVSATDVSTAPSTITVIPAVVSEPVVSLKQEKN